VSGHGGIGGVQRLRFNHVVFSGDSDIFASDNQKVFDIWDEICAASEVEYTNCLLLKFHAAEAKRQRMLILDLLRPNSTSHRQ